MKRLRLLLLPFAVVLELFTMLIIIGVAMFSTRIAIRTLDSIFRLPDLDWYFGR